MGKPSTHKVDKRAFLRFILPLVFSFVLSFGPLMVQAISAWITSSDVPVAVNAEVDLSEQEAFNHQNRHLKGKVEFFYNEWIVSEPENATNPILLQTPGFWMGQKDKYGKDMPLSGYASYRYLIKGLTPGTTVFAFQNIDLPNRIYLNGVLVSSTGSPSKDPQPYFVSTREGVHKGVVVPETGILEYVMEIGNTGEGGASRITAIYLEGHSPINLANVVFAPIALGFLTISLGLMVFFFVTSERKKHAIWLGALLVLVGLFYLFSKDSLLIGLGFFYSGTVFRLFTVILLSLTYFCLLSYGRKTKNAPVVNKEYLALSLALLGATILYPFLMQTSLEWLGLLVLASFPAYTIARCVILAIKGKPNNPILLVASMIFAYGILSVFYSFDAFNIPMILHPTVFTMMMTAGVFATAFNDSYSFVLERRDAAILQRRYRNITNRALARLSSEKETLKTLSLIGEAYDVSLKAGDRRLLGFSSLMRRRLVALRQDEIPFNEEAELESALVDLHNSVSENTVTLLLDIEEGTMMVPPLVFEGIIDELSPLLGEDETLVLSESKDSVSLSFPDGLVPSDEAILAVKEKCELRQLTVTVHKGIIVLQKRGQA